MEAKAARRFSNLEKELNGMDKLQQQIGQPFVIEPSPVEEEPQLAQEILNCHNPRYVINSSILSFCTLVPCHFLWTYSGTAATCKHRSSVATETGVSQLLGRSGIDALQYDPILALYCGQCFLK